MGGWKDRVLMAYAVRVPASYDDADPGHRTRGGQAHPRFGPDVRMTGPSASGHRSSATGIVLLPRDPADGAHESLAHMFAAYEREDDQSDERQGQDVRARFPDRAGRGRRRSRRGWPARRARTRPCPAMSRRSRVGGFPGDAYRGMIEAGASARIG